MDGVLIVTSYLATSATTTGAAPAPDASPSSGLWDGHALLIVLGAIVVVVVALRFGRRIIVKVPGVGTIDGSNDPRPALKLRKIKAETGAVRAKDSTGKGVDAREVVGHTDVEISTGSQNQDNGPKG